MAHLHTDMERLDIHVAIELCEIVNESATRDPDIFFDRTKAAESKRILTTMDTKCTEAT
jgi:hypothetical protein